ncbi:Hypothetical_protein [Hexamita inflata]|uniref:Hypothetical_protein n=1 Tax=Hexamita inflata TaxID=28002 RepID=A0AA86NW08_9EUKA|nr:Hypothetical protein HINF_LOCUS14890 [Hexamita inflata]
MQYQKVIQKGVEWQSYEKINMFALTCLYISTYQNQFNQQLHHNRGVYAIDFCLYILYILNSLVQNTISIYYFNSQSQDSYQTSPAIPTIVTKITSEVNNVSSSAELSINESQVIGTDLLICQNTNQSKDNHLISTICLIVQKQKIVKKYHSNISHLNFVYTDSVSFSYFFNSSVKSHKYTRC